MFSNQFNYSNIISVLDVEHINWERPINNLILTKIEENLDCQYENITAANYETLVMSF